MPIVSRYHFSTSVLTMNSSPLAATFRQGWQSESDLSARRFVLFHILMVLKTKYGFLDDRTSYIARRAELALYSRANSLVEYRNPRTLCMRLHALIIKLYAHQSMKISPQASLKRKASCDDENVIIKKVKATAAPFLLDGHDGVLRSVCSFLDTLSVVALMSTSHSALAIVPQHVTSIVIKANRRPTTTAWLVRFPNLQEFRLVGNNQFGFGQSMENVDMSSNDAASWALTTLEKATLNHLHTLELSHVYCDGLQDPFTDRIGALLEKSKSLVNLSLVGNCITDVGAINLASNATSRSELQLLLDNNFIGEQGAAALAKAASFVSLKNNLMESETYRRLFPNIAIQEMYKASASSSPFEIIA
ncbi:hypothetical protein THRCLA_11212 [Thraustotheca clavata]|uniref:Uncharacterized protein n=1 Tax=Thraustotheca clavata TaxID=74557 RepID=A0A1V9Y8H3_9STRA|nr:hypothetical protein THRCLA_11212 [Thraustotheca clavata]